MRASRTAVLAGFACCAALSCSDILEPPPTGAIRVIATTTGVDLDPNGYFIRVTNDSPRAIQLNGTVIIEGLEPGTRHVHLSEYAPNCAPAANVVSVTITASDTVDVSFTIDCRLNIGNIIVLPLLSGEDQVTEGYFASIDGGEPFAASIGGTVVDSIPAGNHSVTLSGIAPSCTATAATLTAQVAFGGYVTVRHQVHCVARTGFVQVNVTTVGTDIDQDGYSLEIVGFGTRHVASNGTITIPDIRDGVREAVLSGVNGNCTVGEGPSRSFTVGYQATTPIAFAVTCVATSSVRVSVTSTGPDADVLYRARVTSPSADVSGELTDNGAITLHGLGEGSHTVALEDVALNCAVNETTPNPRVINLSAGTTTDVAFTVDCGSASRIAFVVWMNSNSDIFDVKSNGSPVSSLTMTPTAEEHDPAYSPDGSKIVFRSDRDGNSEIYVMNADGSAPVRLTNHPAWDRNPDWSPDGGKIVFTSERDGNHEIYVMNSDGSNVTRLTNSSSYDGKPSWSPDGTRIAFESARSGQTQIWVMNADGSSPTRVTTTGAWASLPAWSPDGTRIAFVRLVECDDYYNACHNVFVANADGTDEVRLMTTRSHDSEPAWSPDGKWIVFETIRCDYYWCTDAGLAAVRSDGSRRTMIVGGYFYNPTWRP